MTREEIGRGRGWAAVFRVRIVAVEQAEMARELRPTRWPSALAHVGLALVAFSAAYTVQPEGLFSARRWASFGLVGLAAVIVGLVRRGESARGPLGAGTLTLTAATALYLSWDPQLTSLPGLSGLGEGAAGMVEPSLAHVGVVLTGLLVALQMAVDRRALPDEVPFRAATVAAAVLVLALGAIMWLGLHEIYDLSGAGGMALLSFRVVAYAVLMVSTLTLSGARAVGSSAHLYLGAAVLVAVARNMVG